MVDIIVLSERVRERLLRTDMLGLALYTSRPESSDNQPQNRSMDEQIVARA
jgi:hypothetical protein